MDFLTLNNITKQFDKHTALSDVSLSVPKGCVFGLLGPNGAGKTTLIRIITQIFAADKGEIFINGKPLIPAHVAQIGYLPEERGLYKKMKVGEQALYLSRLKGMSKHDALKELRKWFRKFEIEDWWERKVEELSKGMQQKVQFITTILHKPELLIFDEPFSGFDPINANLLKQEILKLRDEGATILFSTHNMGSVEELCDKIVLINNSEKILDGNIGDIKETYKQNIFEVQFAGGFNKSEASHSSSYEILDVNESDKIQSVRFRLLNGTTTNDLINKLLPTGRIMSFNEIIPSMDDIFIRVVENAKKP